MIGPAFVSKTLLQRLRSHVLDGSSDSSRFRSPMASPKPTSLRSSQADSSLIIGEFPHGSSSTVRKEPSSPTKPTEQRTESHASAIMSLERRSGVASHYAEERLNKGGRDSTGIPGTGETQTRTDFENFVHDAGGDEHLETLRRLGFRHSLQLIDANARDLHDLSIPYAAVTCSIR